MPTTAKIPKRGAKKRKTTKGQTRTPEQMAPALQRSIGNNFWQARSRHGRFPKIPEGPEGAQMLLDICEDYFEWCVDNPLMEEKVFHAQGMITVHDSPKVRAFTLNGLQLFGDISNQTWINYRNSRQDLVEVIRWAEQTIYDQKFSNAAAGLLNANIIARELGLADKTELTGAGGAAIETVNTNMTAKEAADLYAQTRDQNKK